MKAKVLSVASISILLAACVGGGGGDDNQPTEPFDEGYTKSIKASNTVVAEAISKTAAKELVNQATGIVSIPNNGEYHDDDRENAPAGFEALAQYKWTGSADKSRAMYVLDPAVLGFQYQTLARYSLNGQDQGYASIGKSINPGDLKLDAVAYEGFSRGSLYDASKTKVGEVMAKMAAELSFDKGQGSGMIKFYDSHVMTRTSNDMFNPDSKYDMSANLTWNAGLEGYTNDDQSVKAFLYGNNAQEIGGVVNKNLDGGVNYQGAFGGVRK